MLLSQKTGLVKLRRVLRAIRKHFPQPPEDVLTGNAIDKFLDDLDLCEDKLSEEAGSDGYLGNILKIIFPDIVCIKQFKAPSSGRYILAYSFRTDMVKIINIFHTFRNKLYLLV